MKKHNLTFIAFLLFAIMSSFVSCDSGYDSELADIMENLPNDNQKPEEDPDKEPEGDWGTVLEKTYGNVDQEWPSVIKLQKADGSIVEFKVNLPMEANLGADEYLNSETTDASAFIAFEEADTTCTEYQADGKGNFIRKVTRTQTVSFSKFNKIFTSTWYEAYRFINGKKENFLAGKVSGVQLHDLLQDNSELIEENKKYMREENHVWVSFVFHKKNYLVDGKTFVTTFLGEVEDNENKDPENQEPEKMPDAQVYIEDDVQFLYWTKVFDVNANRWRDALMFKSSSYYYPVVDGVLYKVDASTVAKTDKYNATVFAKGSYLPALITVDGAGWTTIGQYADGTPITQAHDMKNAEIQGIKNFSQTDHAKVTPFVKTSVEEKTYDGKQFWTINGIDVNGKVFASYTVAEK